MAKKKTQTNTFKTKAKTAKAPKAKRGKFKFNPGLLVDRRFQLVVGFFLIVAALALMAAFTSYLFTGRQDQSVVEALGNNSTRDLGLEAGNWLGLLGAVMAHFFIFRWFGIAAFVVPPLLFLLGYPVVFKKHLVSAWNTLKFSVFILFWVSVLLGYMVYTTSNMDTWGFLCGGIGYNLAEILHSFIGQGTYLLLIFALLAFVVYSFNITTLLSAKTAATAAGTTGADDDGAAASAGASAAEGLAPEASLEEALAHESNENAPSEAEHAEDLENWELKKVEDDAAEEENTTATTEEEVPFEVPELSPEPKNTPQPEEEAGLELEVEDTTLIPPPDPAFITGKEAAAASAGTTAGATAATADTTAAAAASAAEAAATTPPAPEPEPAFEVAKAKPEKKQDTQENYDPTLDLPQYEYPPLELLNEYDAGKIQVTKEELEQNKDKIVETLTNFKIGIASIKATIGPTVTLYEIVPEAGVKISKIKNLEDDIALNLAALGIRIIAPIPGKGTIGIEVPNKNREMVSIRSVMGTEKFMKSTRELPVVLGKTISNEVFVTDLSKMPHLLMAGATGQGKSVGLNVILASLIYKKHPSQLKFVLVDPKKVELTLFNKIEQHFLAMLPNAEEAIITDTKKVIYTLNSLCIEMDNRYDLLKDAGCRNIKEYNKKFVERRLNPMKGHRFMPYIVLVIDELADLMMTAGKEIEGPIARLAQLARAIGIHLVIATQRPSVNVITGIIKANFPTRLSFRVTSKVDSRTILDAGGAEQLIGMGDMLLSSGSEITRLQCAFIDTPEVEDLCEFVGNQQGYDSAYLLPEYVGDEEDSGPGAVDLADRDAMFDEAARLIVMHQQGSTSLIQRKLKLGYNRAGRLIDQLETAGIVGAFEGSKAREVLIQDEQSLEQLLTDIETKYGRK